VQAELSPIVSALAPKGSIFAQAEQQVDYAPSNATRFLKHMGFDEGTEAERDTEFASILDLYQRLSKLSREARGYLAIIIANGEVEGNGIVILGSELTSKTRAMQNRGSDYMAVLDQAGFAWVQNDRPVEICARCRLASGENFFQHIRDFCGSNDKLRTVIEECDFTILDEP
jgi:hypothetical protein